jgi:hypothetical protein
MTSTTAIFGNPVPIKELTQDTNFQITREQFEAGVPNDPMHCAGALGGVATIPNAKQAYVGSGGDMLVLIEKPGEEPYALHGIIPKPDCRALTDANDLGNNDLKPKKTVSVTVKAPTPSFTYEGRRERDQKYRKAITEKKKAEAPAVVSAETPAATQPKKPRQTREVRVGLVSRPRPGISVSPNSKK